MTRPTKEAPDAPTYDWTQQLGAPDDPSPVPSRPWEELARHVLAETMSETVWSWDEDYVDALQRALEGKNPEPLIRMLEEGRAMHPACGPPLAAVIRALIEGRGVSGRGRALTQLDDATIRAGFNAVEQHVIHQPDFDPVAWLMKVTGHSRYIIKSSLERTAKPKKM